MKTRRLELPKGASPRRWGQIHGESFAQEIKEVTAIRLGLCVRVGGFDGPKPVLELAKKHLKVLEDFDKDLHEELMGIAEGSGVDAPSILVNNHYTDLRDLGPAMDPTPKDDCTVALAHTKEGRVLVQTWDTHASATPYVMMLRVPESERGPASWVFSIVGCLGMSGLNTAGVAVAINNLKSKDARIGLVWPALVRRMLLERQAKGAFDILMDSPLGSGHHYVIADTKEAFAVETSGHLKEVIFTGSEGTLVHTNHCLSDEVGACSAVAPTSTPSERYDRMEASLRDAPPVDIPDLWSRFASHEGYPRSICTHLATEDNPHGVSTCGASVMAVHSKQIWAVTGCMVENPLEEFEFS